MTNVRNAGRLLRAPKAPASRRACSQKTNKKALKRYSMQSSQVKKVPKIDCYFTVACKGHSIS